MPDFSHDFILRYDASGSGIGGTLSQEVPGDHGPKEHVIAYHSRKLTDTETRYPITQKELLAVVSAVRKYEPMIRHSKIVVYTDHSALVSMLRGSKEQQNSRVMNWLVYLSTMDIKIIDRAGHLNQVADALSRIPQCNNYHDDLHQTTPTKPEEEIPVGFQVSITTHLTDNEVEHRRDRDGPLTRARTRATKHDRSKQTLEGDASRTRQWGSITAERLITEQQADHELSTIIREINDHPDSGGYAKEYFIKDGVLHHRHRDHGKSQDTGQIVIPGSLVGDILFLTHDSDLSGHPSAETVLRKLKRHFTWRNMRDDIQIYIKSCQVCQQRKVDAHPSKVALHPRHPPLGVCETVHVDIGGPYSLTGGRKCFIIVFCCALTGFTVAVPTRCHTGSDIVEALIRDVILRYAAVEIKIFRN